MIGSKKCRKCGYENQMGNRYCSQCGTAFRNMVSLREMEETALSNNSAMRVLLIVVILLFIIASVIVVIALVILRNSFSLAQKNPETVIQETIQTDITTDIADIPTDNVTIAGTLQPHPRGGGAIYSGFRYTVFDSGIDRDEIRTITFWGSKDLAPPFTWDVSEDCDGSVVAWFEGDHGDLYIAANGRIRVLNCSELFAFYSNVEEINFNGVLETSQATGMFRMFQGCNSLISLDLSSFDTSSVTDMGEMFDSCSRLTNLNLDNFDTSQVANMVGMFRGCHSLTNLDLNSFDFSNVQYYGEFMDEGLTINGMPWEQLFQEK